MRKFEQFFKNIADLRSNLRDGMVLYVAKETIGAKSSGNHRTLSVNQTVTYLRYSGKKKLAKQLEVAGEIMRGHIKEHRRYRTDAIDLSEFVKVYRKVVMNRKDPFMRRRIGYALSKVG